MSLSSRHQGLKEERNKHVCTTCICITVVIDIFMGIQYIDSLPFGFPTVNSIMTSVQDQFRILLHCPETCFQFIRPTALWWDVINGFSNVDTEYD